MKKLLFSFFAATTLILAGCFETTDELTLNSDGSGTFTTTNDMSAVVGVAKQMGGKEAEKMEETKIDSTISMSTLVDSIATLTPEEKELMKTGIMHMDVDLKENKFKISMKFPFSKTNDIAKLSKLASKLMGETLKDKLGGEDMPMAKDMPEPSSIDDYFDISYSNGEIKKKLNKEKYAGVESDEYLKGMKEAGGMGIPITSTQVINLPRPAKKVEGKNAKLSDDKMKVTVKADIDDFFDEPGKLEFKIEY